MTTKQTLAKISDEDLLSRLDALLNQSRRVEAEIVAHIAEVDTRRLYARRAAPSMFQYAVEVLRLSEAEAYLRIAVARASRRHPVLLEMLGDGRLHLSGIALLAKHLTESNRDAVLAKAAHKTKRQIEELVASLAPRPDVPQSIRKLPAAGPSEPPTAPASPVESRQLGPDKVAPVTSAPPKPAVEPLAPARYKVTFTVDAALRDKLERLEALLDSDLAEAIDAAVTEKLERLEAARFGKSKTPRTAVEDTNMDSPRSRHIPAAVRRAVCARDGDRCTFVDATGRRCSEVNRLEFHHDDAYAKGGEHTVANIRLVCKSHNLYLAELEYGRDAMERFRQPPDQVSEPAPAYFVRTELRSSRFRGARSGGQVSPRPRDDLPMRRSPGRDLFLADRARPGIDGIDPLQELPALVLPQKLLER